MNISLSGRHMQLSEPTKDYAMEKIEKLERFYDRITDIQTVLTKDGERFCSEVIIGLPAHKNIVVEKSAENLYTAIDESINICERKLRQYKDKQRSMKGHLHDTPQDQ